MSCFCPARIVALFTPFLGYVNENPNLQPLVSNEVIVYEGRTVKLIVPENPLAAGSLQIITNSNEKNFSDWQEVNEKETYELIQQIVQIWEQKGITDYMIYGKESSKSFYSREIVPYPKEGWRFWKQLKVLWNITFGNSPLAKNERERLARDFRNDRDSFSQKEVRQIESINNFVRGNDAFCNQKIIDKQLVFEGKEINVLYNYAPIVIGEGKLHFLVVPKRHCQKFSDLSESEYTEAMQLSQKLVNFYKNKGFHTAYLFDKTGTEAGQTVPHWHEHVIFTATKTQDIFGKLTVLKNMIFGSSPLPPKELQSRVETLKDELSVNLKN